jgi:hypothetical protein
MLANHDQSIEVMIGGLAIHRLTMKMKLADFPSARLP